MAQSEIAAVRALLSSKPRPVGWQQRRHRIEEVGSVWPAADDIKFESADIEGLPAEWSIAPGSDASRVLLFFHGGGYCSGSILSHRRLVSEAGRAARTRTLAVAYRLAFPRITLEDSVSLELAFEPALEDVYGLELHIMMVPLAEAFWKRCNHPNTMRRGSTVGRHCNSYVSTDEKILLWCSR